MHVKFQGASSLKRGIIAVVLIFMVVATAFVWTYKPPPEYHQADIVLEETSVIGLDLGGSGKAPKGFLPDRVEGFLSGGVWDPVMFTGLGRMRVGEKSYSYVFAYFVVYLKGIDVGLPYDRVEEYLLAFFSNSSELDKLFSNYGLPHTYVKAVYQRNSLNSTDYTYLRLDYPNGQPLIEMSAVTPDVTRVTLSSHQRLLLHLTWGRSAFNNLTAIHMDGKWGYFLSEQRQANITFAEDSEVWKYMRWKASYIIPPPTPPYVGVLFMGSWSGKIGWLEWK